MVQIISLGMGVQSTALYLMSSMGQLPRTDYAIFVDVGKEGKGTYEYLDFLQDWCSDNNGIPITVLREKNLYENLLHHQPDTRFTSIPAFTLNDDGSVGMLRRQCTAEYKIQVIQDHIRDHIYGLPKGSRRPATACWQGISLDEIERMSPPRNAWEVKIYPFLGQSIKKTGDPQKLAWAHPMTREEIVRWYLLHGLPVPPKSSCVFCPYQSDRSWAQRKRNSPEDFAAAVAVDESIRNSTRSGIHNPVYLHRSCRPLAEAVFDDDKDESWGECTGNCHV